MPSCIVKGCNVRWRHKNSSFILHSFPKNLENIRSWLLQTKQEFGNLEEMCQRILVATKGQFRMCSQHFTPDCYYQKGTNLSLKKEALPTIFPDEAAIAENARKKKFRHRRSKVPLPDDPSTLTLDFASCSGSSPPIVAGFPLGVISVEHDYQLPLFKQEPIPLISEEGYYISRESFIQKRKKVFGAGHEPFPPKKRKPYGRKKKYHLNQVHKSTLTNRITMKHKEVQTDLSKDDHIVCSSMKEGLNQARSTPLAMLCKKKAGQVATGPRPQTSGTGLPSDVNGLDESPTSGKSAEVVHSSNARSSTSGPTVMEKTPTMISVACGLGSGPKEDMHNNNNCSVKMEEEDDQWGLTGAAVLKDEEKDLGSLEIPVMADLNSLRSESRYVVVESCLDRLLMQSRCLADENCKGHILKVEKNFVGSRLSVKAECSKCHQFHMWDSQP